MANDTQSGYDDRTFGADESDEVLPKPQLEIIVDGNSVFKPGMKTLFVDDYGEGDETFSAVITGSYCTCDMVEVGSMPICTCDSVCSCESVCTCESNCSCDGYSSSSNGGSTGGTVSCGSPCACVPVH